MTPQIHAIDIDEMLNEEIDIPWCGILAVSILFGLPILLHIIIIGAP